ncbi:hypothetical protein KUTeg_007839 [Tegillarca granosa]|uniref:Receptor ligand binding region domain-containing protein n=1 Tax=Tegillarca granosa TaxID=220873 RepID=A0ABQ9FEI3_TEGGR|nr:hypothetical protein KUTeg_007839 [Tegillarca granosa]
MSSSTKNKQSMDRLPGKPNIGAIANRYLENPEEVPTNILALLGHMNAFFILVVCVAQVKAVIDTSLYLHGDVVIGGLFQIYGNKNGECSDINIGSVQNVETVRWVLKTLNDMNYIPGVNIGFLGLPTCRDITKANNRTFELVTEMRNKLYNNCSDRNIGPIVGVIGPEFSSEVVSTSPILSSAPLNERLLQIGFSTTASGLSNTNVYKNFYRIIPSDDNQVQMMILLMKNLDWNYIAIIYEDDAYGIGGKKHLEEMASKENICIAESFPVSVSNGVNYKDLDSILRNITRSSITGVVFFGVSSTANSLLVAAESSPFKEKPTFIFSEGSGIKLSMFMTTNNVILNSGKGSFIVVPTKRHVEEFATYWKNLFTNMTALITESKSNPWLLDAFHVYTGCRPASDISSPGCNAMTREQIKQKYEDAFYTNYAIEATFVFAKLLKEIHSEMCKNNICPHFAITLSESKDRILAKIETTTFNFQTDFPLKLKTYNAVPKTISFVNHTDSVPLYELYHYRSCESNPQNFCIEKVGNWTDSNLILNVDKIKDYHQNNIERSWPNINKAQCQPGTICSKCLPNDLANYPYFEDGDVIVVGIVPVYNKDTTNSLRCSEIRLSLGVELAEGMLFAVKTVNDKTGEFSTYFKNKKVGVILLNSCNQPLATQDKILRLHQEGVRLRNGKYLNVSHKIMGYAGALGSSISLAMSNILTKLPIVQVSFASTAVTLSDRKQFPYFLRVCTPDDKQAKTMMKIIKELNSNYIQIVYSEGTYGEGGRAAVANAARSSKICIANEIKVEEGKYNGILNTMRKNSYAKIVLLFIRSHIVKEFLDIIDTAMEHGEFMFIGSEAWGKNAENIKGRNKIAGSLVLSLEMAQRHTFEDYLNTKKPESYTLNPWFQHFVETRYQCYLPDSYDKSSAKPCDPNLRITRPLSGTYYTQDHWTPFAINAMFTLLMGSNSAFNELCGTDSKVLCEDFLRKPADVWKKISEQKLDIFGTGQSVPVFDSNGDGNAGYRIYNVQKNTLDTQTLKYTQIGQAPIDDNQFQFDKSKFTRPDGMELPSNCPNDVVCDKCFGKYESATMNNTKTT